jgi:hypothetical protein
MREVESDTRRQPWVCMGGRTIHLCSMRGWSETVSDLQSITGLMGVPHAHTEDDTNASGVSKHHAFQVIDEL